MARGRGLFVLGLSRNTRPTINNKHSTTNDKQQTTHGKTTYATTTAATATSTVTSTTEHERLLWQFWLKCLLARALLSAMPLREPDAEPSSSVLDPKAKAKPKPVQKPRARAAAAGFAEDRSVVRRAAKELVAETVGPTLPVPAEANVEGPIPPPPSSSGKRYYLFPARFHEEAFIVCGQEVTLRHLGGSWFGHTLLVPRGFCSLENALNTAHNEGYAEIRVRW